jgi:anti-sigma B factor antagonist
VVALAGAADLTNVAALGEALAAQVSGETRHLTVDLSGLRFADSASVRELVLAGRALHERGGVLVLVRPQPGVARVLTMMGVDQAITIETETGTGTGPGPEGR